MPARSKAQRRAMAIAEHHPDELYARNAGLAEMTHQQLHDFAATKETGLPKRVKRVKATQPSLGDQIRSHLTKSGRLRGNR